jgi:hypothetical protein
MSYHLATTDDPVAVHSFTIRLRQVQPSTDREFDRMLRALVKVLLRGYGLRCETYFDFDPTRIPISSIAENQA